MGRGSTRSSFHSTLNASRDCSPTKPRHGGSDATRAARRSGEEYSWSAACFAGSPRRAGGAVGGPLRLPLLWRYNVLNARVLPQAALLDACARISDGRLRSSRPCREAARRHLAAAGRYQASVVRGRRTGRRAIEVADAVRIRVLDWWDSTPEPHRSNGDMRQATLLPHTMVTTCRPAKRSRLRGSPRYRARPTARR